MPIMNRRTCFWIILPIFIHLNVADGKAPINEENRLLGYLLEDYNRDARPTLDIHKPIDCYISFYLTKILGLDEKNQVLTTFGWLEVHWVDDYMVWNSSEFGGLKRVIVPPDLIWLPDFGLENSAESIYDEQADKKFRAGVDSDGSIQWVPGGKFVTSCQLDITLYPFDHQICEMDFVDWTYDGRFVNLINGSNEISLGVYKKHGEWDILKTEARKIDQYFESDPGIPFPTVKFILYLQRKPRFYMINVVAPCILMSILALLVFYLPPDSGEKVSLGITVLLSFSVFLLLIAENVPKTSDYVPLIGIYLTMVMVMTAFSIVISVIVLDLHHHQPSCPPPSWLRGCVLNCMARMVCMKTPAHGDSNGGPSGKLYHVPSRSRYTRSVRSTTVDDDDLIDESHLPSLNAIMHGMYDDLECVMSSKHKRPLFEEMLQHLREITNKLKRNFKREQSKEEWRFIAKVIDRFLLIIFLFAIVSLTLTILYIYPTIAHQILRKNNPDRY